MNWNLWAHQAWTITKMELKRYVLARRWLGVYAAAFAPVGLLVIAAFQIRRNPPSISDLSEMYAVLFQTYMLRLAIFLSCALVFSQLFRGEILEKTLHFYLLAPVRREVIAAGKYLAGVAALTVLFATTTILTNILIYIPRSSWREFFLEDAGFSNLFWYVLVTVLACVAYGSIFTLCGLLFRNPLVSAFIVGLWEAFYFILPETLQKFTVMHYLQSLLPLVIDRGPFSVIIDPSGVVWSVLVLVGVAGGFVWIAGRVLSRSEVTYAAD